MKHYNPNDPVDEFDKIDRIGNKVTEIVASIGMATATTSLLSLITGVYDSPQSLAFLTGGTIIASPLMYFGMKKLKNKADDRLNRDMHHAGQIAIMFQDALEPDRHITSMTTLFLHEIIEYFEKNNIDFDDSKKMNINQFLYLINANYYEEISKRLPSLNREQLIRQVLNQIIIYLQDTKKQTFTEKEAAEVMKSCFFIPDELKKQIVTEFKKSKVGFGKQYFYEIARRDIDNSINTYLSKREEEHKGKYSRFDIDDANDYHTLIQAYASDDNIKENYGDPNTLDWDMELLVRIITLIGTKYRAELLELKGDKHSNFNLASSFIFNAITYALVNKKTEVGYTEMLNTFKNWSYLPFDMKLRVIDDIIEQENLSQQDHPYGLKKTSKNSTQKIIKFPDKYQK